MSAEKSPIVIAWEKWRYSGEGIACSQGAVGIKQQIMENRLWRAFMAGANAEVTASALVEKPPEPKLGACDLCASCDQKIVFNGVFWQHLERNPRHPALPK
jgi:hypothetical protein